MATTEPVQSPLKNEEKPANKAPAKEVEENGQDNEPTGPPEENVAVEKVEEPAADDGKDRVTDETDKPDTEEADKGSEEEDEEGEGSSEDEPQKGSLDGPVQIMTGKRERKKVERLTMQSPPDKDKEKFEIKDGKGVKLGDCPIIEFHLQRTNADMLKPLYRVLFGKMGKLSEIKKNIRKFSGFPFTKDDTSELQRKEKQLERFTTSGLKELCMWLGLERKGTKEELMSRILDYCLEPVMSDKKPPVKRKKGTKKSGKKKKVGAKGDTTKRKRRSRGKSAEAVDDEDEDEDEDEEMEEDDDDKNEEQEEDQEEEEEEEEEQSEEDEDSEYEEPKKKKPRKATPKSAKKTKAKTPAKKSPPKKSPTKKPAPKNKVSEDESSDEDVPLVKKSDGPPSETEIRSVITKFLDGANLEQVTMKTVCKKVYETYPKFDLTPKKDFIKSTVKEIISS